MTAHAVHLVGSALADPYLAFAAGINGLAGPLHGLANQEVILWLNRLQNQLQNDISDEKIKNFVLETIKSGQVIESINFITFQFYF